MYSAAKRLADFAEGDHVNSATETQTPSAKVAAPRHSSGRIIFRYGLALGSVAAATALGFLADRCDLHESVFTFFVLAVALTSCTLESGRRSSHLRSENSPSITFLLHRPIVSVSRVKISPISPCSPCFSGLLIWFGVVRRRAEADLRQSRDELEIKVAERTAELRKTNEQLQQEVAERRRAEEILRERASLLDLTHDTVFVRDMNNVITYWNRGAQGAVRLVKSGGSRSGVARTSGHELSRTTR